MLDDDRCVVATSIADGDRADREKPNEGANSFTDGQAQDRVLAAGFAKVSALTKDEPGIHCQFASGTASAARAPLPANV
jgi:hypothetical protein